MGTIHVQEFTGGLDARRVPEATSGGMLIKARNGHINRGGEFEQRAAFVPTHFLPDGTVGLFAGKDFITVFGSGTAPSGLPSGVQYQRLPHPSGSALLEVMSADLYAGKIYAVGRFADGQVYHFYGGTHVTDFADGKARASFRVAGGTSMPLTQASVGMGVTGGVNGAGVTHILIGGVNLLASPVAWNTSNAVTMNAIVSAINSHTTVPNYTAMGIPFSGGFIVFAEDPGAEANGRPVSVIHGANMTMSWGAELENGTSDATTLSMLYVGGVPIMAGPVDWRTDNAATASAIAQAVNSHTSSPNYTAIASGDQVTIVAAAAGAAANGKALTTLRDAGFRIDPADVHPVMSGGVDAVAAGTFVKTMGDKVTAVIGPNFYFSGIKNPMNWSSDGAVGAGFIDLSTESSGAEDLKAVAKYQGYAAIFSANSIQTWYLDPDPALNRLIQVLNNTGTTHPHTVQQYGDTDVFYLDDTGVRSLRARDSSNAAATTDVGVAIDEIVQGTINPFHKPIGLIEPNTGQYWLIMGPQAFVFSHYPGSKISAWTTYDLSYSAGGAAVFEASDAIVFRSKVYIRSGDVIFAYGGVTGTGEIVYDDTEAEVWLPYLDANDPTREKEFKGVDVVARGEWAVYAAMDTNQQGSPAIAAQSAVAAKAIFTINVAAFSPSITSVTIGGVNILGSAVSVANPVAMAEAVARQINSYASSPDYTAVPVGSSVVITADTAGAAANGRALAVTHTGVVDVTIVTPVTVGGADAAPMVEAVPPAEEQVGVVADNTTYDIDGKVPLNHQATHMSLRFRSRGKGPHKLSSCVIHYEGGDDED